MKLSIAVLALPSLVAGYNVGGSFDAFGRPLFVTQRGCRPSSQQQQQANRNLGRQVDRAFEELNRELYSNSRRRGGGVGRQAVGGPPRVDEETLRQQQEWVNRAFGLASEVAKGMSSSPREVKESNEALRQQQEWVNSIFGFAQDVASGASPTFVRSEVLRNDEHMFQVALDLPGVKSSDVNITVEGDELKILNIRGKREIAKVEDGVSHSKQFSKSFALDPTADRDNISATLDNGVLLISVPKSAKEEVPESRQKILVTPISDEDAVVDGGKVSNDAFQLELDVPGVKVSNIDVTISSEGINTLHVTAKREMGTESDGSPRIKETSKSFRIDDLVDTSSIKATLNRGVLRISAPKDMTKPEAKIQKIPISPVEDANENATPAQDADQ